LPGANTLAYLAYSSATTKEQFFISLLPGGGVSDGLDDGTDHPLASAEEHAFAVGVDLSSQRNFEFLKKIEKFEKVILLFKQIYIKH
jgi:hypothetical protein